MGAKQLSMEEAVLKKTNYYYMGAIVLFVFSAINLLGSILAFILFMESGAAFLTLSITTFIVAIILFKKYKKILKANKSLEKAIAATKNFLIEREENYPNKSVNCCWTLQTKYGANFIPKLYFIFQKH